MSTRSKLSNDLILSVIHEIEQEKFYQDLPDQIYVTVQEICTYISKMRDQLRGDYSNLDFSELKKTCELVDDATFDECLHALVNQSNNIKVLNEKIPKPLFNIMKELWQSNQLIAFPPQGYPKSIQQFFDRTYPEYGDMENFFKENKIKPEQVQKQTSFFSKRLNMPTNDRIRFRSKIFEIIRLLPKISFTPQMNYRCQRYRKNPFDKLAFYSPNVSSVRYVQERKILPPRSTPLESLFSELKGIIENGHTCSLLKKKTFIRSTFDSTKLLQSMKFVREALEDPEILGKDGALSDFQMNSTLHVFLNLFLDDTHCNRWCNEETCRLSKRNLTIVADTGAGKTYAFIIAPPIYIAYKQLEDPNFRVTPKPNCILIYPRRDLAFDQHKTLQKLAF